MVEPYRPQMTILHGACALRAGNVGDRHTLRIYNIYCFSTAIMVTRTRLSVTLDAHRLTCSNFLILIYGEVHTSSSIRRKEVKFDVKRIDMF